MPTHSDSSYNETDNKHETYNKSLGITCLTVLKYRTFHSQLRDSAALILVKLQRVEMYVAISGTLREKFLTNCSQLGFRTRD